MPKFKLDILSDFQPEIVRIELGELVKVSFGMFELGDFL